MYFSDNDKPHQLSAEKRVYLVGDNQSKILKQVTNM